jgi:hypothetical protein
MTSAREATTTDPHRFMRSSVTPVWRRKFCVSSEQFVLSDSVPSPQFNFGSPYFVTCFETQICLGWLVSLLLKEGVVLSLSLFLLFNF